LARDRATLGRLAEGALTTAAQHSWSASFAEFITWSDAIAPAAAIQRNTAADEPAGDETTAEAAFSVRAVA
jgi:hypothetical protein